MRKMKPQKFPIPNLALTNREREELKMDSIECFGRSSRWKTIMRKGRWVEKPGHQDQFWMPVTLQEIKDTMTHILSKGEVDEGEEVGQREAKDGSTTGGSSD